MVTTINARDFSPNVVKEKMEKFKINIIQMDAQVLFFKVIIIKDMIFVSMPLLAKHRFTIRRNKNLRNMKNFKHG